METEAQESNPKTPLQSTPAASARSPTPPNKKPSSSLRATIGTFNVAVSTFLDNDNVAAAPIVTHPAPGSYSLSPSPSHSPEYSPSQSPTRSRSSFPAPYRPAYQVRSKHATSGTSKEDNKPHAARKCGIRTLSDLNRHPTKDGSDSDSDETIIRKKIIGFFKEGGSAVLGGNSRSGARTHHLYRLS